MSDLFKHLFVLLSPVIDSVLLRDTVTPDVSYPVTTLTFSTRDAYKQIKFLFFSYQYKVRHSFVWCH